MRSPSPPMPCLPCSRCRTIDANLAYRTNSSPKNVEWRDRYPEFPNLKASAQDGCAFCGLLRHAMLHVYSNAEIAKVQRIVPDSTWPKTKWNGDIQICDADFGTDGSMPDVSIEEMQRADRSPKAIRNLKLMLWPYPPPRDHEPLPRFPLPVLWFNIYTQPSKPNFDS